MAIFDGQSPETRQHLNEVPINIKETTARCLIFLGLRSREELEHLSPETFKLMVKTLSTPRSVRINCAGDTLSAQVSLPRSLQSVLSSELTKLRS